MDDASLMHVRNGADDLTDHPSDVALRELTIAYQEGEQITAGSQLFEDVQGAATLVSPAESGYVWLGQVSQVSSEIKIYLLT